jgi:predicted Fe-Mo cluster-binding NifX family protein
MRAALTAWDGRISPVFDVSREALVVTIENGAVVARSVEKIEVPTPTLKVDRLLDLGVETLICGAISLPLHRELTHRGVEVIPFVAGEMDEVIESFLRGALPTPALSMPGCCGRKHRFRGGRGQGNLRCRVGSRRRGTR